MERCRGKTVIEAAPHETGLPIGVLSVGVLAIRLRSIAVQPAIYVMEIRGCKPLQHLPLTLIPATPRPATHVLAYHSHALTVDALAPGHDFTRRPLQLRRAEYRFLESLDHTPCSAYSPVVIQPRLPCSPTFHHLPACQGNTAPQCRPGLGPAG